MKTVSATIEEVSANDGRIKVRAIPRGLDKALTFSFFQTKKDGGMSKAYEQYKELRPMAGEEIHFAYNENEGEYDGKPITYRNIAYFVDESETSNLPDRTGMARKSSGNTQSSSLNDRVLKGLTMIYETQQEILERLPEKKVSIDDFPDDNLNVEEEDIPVVENDEDFETENIPF